MSMPRGSWLRRPACQQDVRVGESPDFYVIGTLLRGLSIQLECGVLPGVYWASVPRPPLPRASSHLPSFGARPFHRSWPVLQGECLLFHTSFPKHSLSIQPEPAPACVLDPEMKIHPSLPSRNPRGFRGAKHVNKTLRCCGKSLVMTARAGSMAQRTSSVTAEVWPHRGAGR